MLVMTATTAGIAIGVTEYRAQFPSAYESVGRARRAITLFAREWFAGENLSDIESAAGEALANCAEHGHANETQIDVGCGFDGHKLTIEIKDAGRGFERWNASDYVKPLSSAPRGYGTYIMRELMDEVEYTDHGSRIRLVKRLPASAVARRNESRERFG